MGLEHLPHAERRRCTVALTISPSTPFPRVPLSQTPLSKSTKTLQPIVLSSNVNVRVVSSELCCVKGKLLSDLEKFLHGVP